MNHNHNTLNTSITPPNTSGQLTNTTDSNSYCFHNHFSCQHGQITLCAYCNVCYCQACGKEWYQSITWTVPYTYPQTIYGTTVTSGGQGVLCGNVANLTQGSAN